MPRGIPNTKSYYIFRYRSPGGPNAIGNRAWKRPKEYFGPFLSLAEAKDRIDTELNEWRQSMRDTFGSLTKKEERDAHDHFRIRHLTDAEFRNVWGGAPSELRPMVHHVATRHGVYKLDQGHGGEWWVHRVLDGMIENQIGPFRSEAGARDAQRYLQERVTQDPKRVAAEVSHLLRQTKPKAKRPSKKKPKSLLARLFS